MAQEHQEYVQTKVNPILENLVTQVLLERPEKPVPFMIQWLAGQTSQAKDFFAGVGSSEVERLRQEAQAIREEVAALEAKLGQSSSTTLQKKAEEEDEEEASKKPKRDDDDDEEEEEDDDYDVDAPMEAPPAPASYLKKGPRASVSAEAYGQWNQIKAFTPPVHPKTEEQKASILACIQQTFLFSCLDEKDRRVIVDAMVEKKAAPEEVIIKEGDDGEVMFVIEKGIANCFKTIDGKSTLVKVCKANDIFGELALLYNCPRAATVVAMESLNLWQLDRKTFNHIVRDASMKKREMHESFLKSVDLLKSLGSYELSQLAETLRKEEVAAGTTVITQGEDGDKFYLVEAGVLDVVRNGKPAMEYKVGDYFGELALLKETTRQATVTARTDATLLWVDERGFKLLLGSLRDKMDKNATSYAP